LSQELEVNLFTSQLWPQEDIRDPLGVWGARLQVTGTSGAGEIKVGITVPQAERAAYVYTCYSVNVSPLATAGQTTLQAGVRLLTNWPNVDPAVGVQGYGSNLLIPVGIQAGGTAPVGGPTAPLINASDRFVLLFDPRPQPTGDLTIVELKVSIQVENDTYTFEAYGYYWDRSILEAPGGPRHPGSR